MMELNPTDVDAWFASYGALLLNVTRLAHASAIAVPLLAVGIELLLIAPHTAHWQALIGHLRASCLRCLLTYDANPLTVPSEQTVVGFWPQLDFVGVDLYFPYVLSRDMNATATMPGRAAMRALYDHILDVKLMQWYRNLSGSLPPLLVAESGYPSSNFGLQSPWLSAPEGCRNASLHLANGYNPYAGNQSAQAAGLSVQFEALTAPAVAASFAGFVQFWQGYGGTGDGYATRDAPDSSWACGWTTAGKAEPTAMMRAAFALPSK